MPSTEATLRLTVAALMHLTGERQAVSCASPVNGRPTWPP